MQKRWYSHMLLLVSAATLVFGKNETPGQMGFRRVRASDEAVVALLAQRVVQGLQTNDPYLYQSFVVENLNKLAPDAPRLDYSVETASGKLNLRFVKNGARWNLLKTAELAALAEATQNKLKKTAAGFSLLSMPVSGTDENTFIRRELAPEHQLSMLSRRVTAARLNRQLFSMPTGSALFARLQQFDSAPYFQASYVQLVTDPAWNRIVYGDYQKWIKAYNGAETGLALNHPQGITVDPNGTVYVADLGNSRILALQLNGSADDLKLSFLGKIGGDELAQPAELAWDDRGTIFDASDDLLWVIDRGTNTLRAYPTSRFSTASVVAYTTENFVDLAALAIGRFDGRSDGNIYLADAGTRKILRLYFDGSQIVPAGSFQGEAEMLPAALATDHWGNVYLADEAHRQIQKLSPALEPLAALHSEDASFQPVRFQPLFGSLVTSANQASWSGYDQAFLLEKWTENSGARRYELGIDFHIDQLQVTADLSALTLAGKLTDPGQLQFALVPAQGNAPVGVIADAWYNAGMVQLNWDRRLSNGDMIAPGYYKLQQTLQSTYEKPENVITSPPFYIPLYYYDDCGVVSRDAHLARGARLTVAEQTIVTDAEEVVYRFNNLNPAVTYEAQASYFSGNGQVEQAWYAGQSLIHAPVTVASNITKTAWLAIPPAAIADRTLDLRFVKTGGSGNASVAEIWLREANYHPNQPPALETTVESIPQAFALQQNYPNPFNPSTTIAFSIPANYRGGVSLRIYNMLGALVRELVAGELAPGQYSKVWDGLDNAGRTMATGLYVYQLRAGNFSATRKLLLMK
ncbi:MAG: hypothetical protein ALAOOOJD_00607 [bacterium]|nr:hypothetical protein [bacterium]